MKKLIMKFFLKIIGKKSLTYAIDLEELNIRIANYNSTKCKSQVLSGQGTNFYAEAEVNNLQEDVTKITIGKNTHIRGQLLVFKYGGEISVGDNCFIGKDSRIWSGDSLRIGNNVLISHNVNIIDTNSHEIDYLERAQRFREMIDSGSWIEKENITTSPITIKDYAWISFGATILKGVTIGRGAIVSANAVVTKDVPDFTMVAGNPAKTVKDLN